MVQKRVRPKKSGPRVKEKPRAGRLRHREIPESFDNQNVSWQLTRLDWDGPWGWNRVDMSSWRERIYPKLKSFESMKWTEVKKAKKHNHSVQVSGFAKKARDRIVELGLGEYDELFSMRLSSKERIYGILSKGVLAVIWYDPDHKVYPSNLRHT